MYPFQRGPSQGALDDLVYGFRILGCAGILVVLGAVVVGGYALLWFVQPLLGILATVAIAVAAGGYMYSRREAALTHERETRSSAALEERRRQEAAASQRADEERLQRRKAEADRRRPVWPALFSGRADPTVSHEADGHAFRVSYEDRRVDGWGEYPSALVLTTTTERGATVTFHSLGRDPLAGSHVQIDGVDMPWQFPEEADIRLQPVWESALEVFDEIARTLTIPSSHAEQPTSPEQIESNPNKPTEDEVLDRL